MYLLSDMAILGSYVRFQGCKKSKVFFWVFQVGINILEHSYFAHLKSEEIPFTWEENPWIVLGFPWGVELEFTCKNQRLEADSLTFFPLGNWKTCDVPTNL